MISKQVEEITKNYRQNSTKILEGLERNQWETIKRVYFYKNDSFFENSNPDAVFWQVVSQFLPHYAKLLDIDPKDLRPKGKGDTNQYQAWILRQKLFSWFKQEGKLSGDDFSVFIDDLTKNVVGFGSYITKIHDNEPEFVDLRNIVFDPTVKTIRGEDKVEYHYLTESEIKKKSWDNIEKVIDNAEEEDGKKEIWEFHGDIDGDFTHIIGAGYGSNEVIAFEEIIKEEDDPYYDVHLGPYEGMWLRKGIYETCFPEQWRALELVNQNREATQIASLLLLRSDDPETTGNVLHQAISGQILKSSDLQQVGIDNKAFATLLNELQIIQEQVRSKLQLPDIATGESQPSGTPFRGMALMSSSQKDAFKQTRVRVVSGIVNIIERILPELVKEWNRGDIIEITEDQKDIETYDEAIRRVALINVYQKANDQGVEITEEIEQRVEQMVDEKIKKHGRKIKTPKGFFNFEYGFRIDPTGELIEKKTKNDAMIQSLMLIMQNPAILEIPLFKQLLENNDIEPFKLTPELVGKLQAQEVDPQQLKNMLNGQETGIEANSQ